MKSLSKVLSIFQNFCAKIKNQFDTSFAYFKIRQCQKKFSSFFVDLILQSGIVHQSPCPYTRQHNGIAERKNRHLLEVTRTLLIHMRVPKVFWRDVVLMTTYQSHVFVCS